MEIKLIDKYNFTRDSMRGFRRYQEVKNVYRLRDGNMTLVFNPFTEDWDAARLLQKAEEILKGKYVTYCAFEKNCVVGEIMLIPQLNKGTKDGSLLIASTCPGITAVVELADPCLKPPDRKP